MIVLPLLQFNDCDSHEQHESATLPELEDELEELDEELEVDELEQGLIK